MCAQHGSHGDGTAHDDKDVMPRSDSLRTRSSNDEVSITDVVQIDTEDNTYVRTRKTPRWIVAFEGPQLAKDTVPSPPPDGGWIAWSQVLGGFLMIFLCWGFINSFGLFQLYYSTNLLIGTSPSNISWIGPIQLFLLMFIGAYSGSAADSGYYRTTVTAGIFFFVLGVFMISFCTQYWQLLLAHGVCTGVGNGLMFIPTISVASTYFSPKRKNIAIGLMFCGSAIGGILLPLIFDRLIPKIGFGWTLRVFGFISLGIFAITLVLMKKRLPPKEDTRILTFEALRDKVFVLFVTGAFFNFLGLFFAFFYLPSFARTVLGLDFTAATSLLLVINGVALPGRLIPAWLADQRQWKGVGPLTVLLPVNFGTSIMLFAWIGVKTDTSAYVFATIYGFFASGLQVLFPACLSEMTTDARKAGAQLGWGFTICSFACLLGNPIGGLILGATDNNYLYAQVYSGICLVIGFSITTIAAVSKLKIAAQVTT